MNPSKAILDSSLDSPYSPSRRNLISTLAGMTALGSLPFQVLAQNAPAGHTVSQGGGVLSWEEYVDMLKPAGDLIARTWEPQSDQIRAELYRQLVMNITLGYFMYFQSDPDHPDWIPFMNSVFMMQPNPDDVYLLARIRGDATYKISGDRGTVHILNFSTGRHVIGMQDATGPSYNSYDAGSLELGPDGSLDVIFSTVKPKDYEGNWWYLHPESEYIMVRQRSYDWGNEREARLAIQRVDAAPIKPRMSKEEIDRNIRALLGGFTRRLSNWGLDYQKKLVNQSPTNTIYMGKHSTGSKQWDQYYFEGTYQIDADEALIFETELPEKRPYWNVMMIDELWNQIEFVYRQSSLNGHQARIDADGKFRAVVSLEDPGVPNWLDTGGYLRGQIMGRWLRCDSHPLPTLKKVKFKDIRKYLPSDTPVVSKEERDRALRARSTAAQLRRRW